MENFRPKAIALMSGGLDSALAAKIIVDQGVQVIGLHLAAPFGCKTDVQKVADSLGIQLIIKDKGEAYLELVKNPKYGYGKNMNPCIDCRIYMFQMAEVVMEQEKAQFIITGEVVGQRPMSQVRKSLDLIDKKSETEKLVLRPLSAHLLEPTYAEEQGWVNRDKLFHIAGRARNEQLQMAKDIGVTEYAKPGGGCLLTESAFSNRLRDFFAHETGAEGTEERLAKSQLLRLGRHFRIDETCKMIIGRNQEENIEIEMLWKFAKTEFFKPFNFDGPSAVLVGAATDSHRNVVAGTISRYSKIDEGKIPQVRFENICGENKTLRATQTIEIETLEKMRL